MELTELWISVNSFLFFMSGSCFGVIFEKTILEKLNDFHAFFLFYFYIRGQYYFLFNVFIYVLLQNGIWFVHEYMQICIIFISFFLCVFSHFSSFLNFFVAFFFSPSISYGGPVVHNTKQTS